MSEEEEYARYLKEFNSNKEEFAGASVKASAPKHDDRILAELQKLPSDYGMNISKTDEEIAAMPKPDAEMNIYRPQEEEDGDYLAYLAKFNAAKPEEEPSTPVQKEPYKETLIDTFNKLISSEDSYSRYLKVKNRMHNTNEQYLSTTIDNPLTATGSALLATGAGLNKVAEDITGYDLHADRAIKMVQNINKNLSSDVKLFGDITASITAGPGIIAPSLQLGAQTLGEGKGYTEASIVTAASMLVGTAGKLIIDNLITNPNLTSTTTKLMLDLNQGRISEKEFAKMMEGVPESDRVLVFAESQKLFKGNIKDAIKGDNSLRAAYGKRLEARRDIAMSFTADEKQMETAAKEYSKMRELIDTELPDLYTPTNIVESISKLNTIYATDPSSVGTAIRQITSDLSGDISVGTALDIRQNINSILRKPSIKNSYNARTSIQEIKDSLDSFIALNVNKPRAEGLPPYKQVVDDAINSYRQTKNDYMLGKLIEKNTKSDYAVDWSKLNKDINKAGLHSDNVDLAIPVLKALEERFVNDKALSSAIVSTGAGEGTGALGAWSKAVKVILDFTSPIFNQARHTDLRIQKDILKAIKNPNNDYLGFIDDMLKNKSLPLEVKQALRATTEVEQQKLLGAPADFTVRADGTAVRQSGDAAQDALSKEPINTTIVDDADIPSTSVKPNEDIIDVEWWNPTSTVVTPDGHVLSMEELLRAESLPDNMRLPEKASAPIKNFFDMKYKMKTDPALIKAREEVKKAKTQPAKDKAKERLLKQLEYQRLRDQGMSPGEAHRMSLRSSGEVGGALAGGTINGVTIDDNGNIQVDPEAFLIGAAGGAAAVKGGKALGKYIDEGNELMMQQAGGGTPPISSTIDYAKQHLSASQIQHIKTTIASGDAEDIQGLYYMYNNQNVLNYIDIVRAGKDKAFIYDISNKFSGYTAKLSSDKTFLSITKDTPQGIVSIPAMRKQDGSWGIDTSSLTSGSGEGKKVYFAFWDWLSENNFRYSENSLTDINYVKLPINQIDYIKQHPNTTVFSNKPEEYFKEKLLLAIEELQYMTKADIKKDSTDTLVKELGPKGVGNRSIAIIKDFLLNNNIKTLFPLVAIYSQYYESTTDK